MEQVCAQDASFTQFYANPMHLNPALAGNTECGRLNLQYRNQWPALNKAYVTYNVAYDQSLPAINSGFGVMVMRDQQGEGLTTGQILLDYLHTNFKFRLNHGSILASGLLFIRKASTGTNSFLLI